MPSENSGPRNTRTSAQEVAAAKAAIAAKAAAAAAAKARAKAAAAQEKRDAARSAGRNSPVSPSFPNPGPTTPTPIRNNPGPSAGSSSPANNNVDTTPAMQPSPAPIPVVAPAPVRIANRNVTDISSLVPQFNAEQIQKLLFENISAIELSIIERHDTIEGINQRYSIISNLSEIRKKYDAGKQLSAMEKFNPLTSIYAINLEDKIPQEDYIILENLDSTYQYLDENDQLVTRERGYSYIDTNGDLVIDLINLEKNQQVEVQIDRNGTIYKVEL